MYQSSGDDRVDLFRLLVALGIRMRSLMDRQLAPDGLTTQQAVVLTMVETADRPLSVADVSRLLGTTHQNTRQLVEALIRKGLLTAELDERDRRSRRLSLTARVAEVFEGRDADDRRAVREWTAALDDEQAALAVELLSRLLPE
jgi:DNA-binding MarR family transcriptional regulator